MRMFVPEKEKVKDEAGDNGTIISYMTCNHPVMWLCCLDKTNGGMRRYKTRVGTTNIQV
jgi:hypothetical protein